MKAREKLVEFLLKAQKEGILIDRHLIALAESGGIDDLKILKANIDRASAEMSADPFATIRGKLTKSLLYLQSKGLIKDSSIIAKVENADLKTLKQIQDNLGKALKITSFTKENVKRLLKLQREGKLKDPSLITKCEIAGELFFKIFDETLKKKTYKSPAHERFGPKLVDGGHATWDDLNALAPDEVRDLHDEHYPMKQTYSRTGGPKGTGFESKTYTKEFKGMKKSTPKPTTLKKQIAKMLPAFMGRATGGVSGKREEPAPIGIEAMTIPFKYRSDYRRLRIGGMEHEEAKESAMSSKRAEPEEHVKQLKENPFGKSEPTWGAPKKSPKDIAEVPHHPDKVSKYLDKLENHPHLKDWENKPMAMVHHMRQQGVDAEYHGTENRGGVMHHDDGSAELLDKHPAHHITIRGKQYTTVHPKVVESGRQPRWIHVKSMKLSPKGEEAMGRYLDQQTAQGLTIAAHKKKPN